MNFIPTSIFIIVIFIFTIKIITYIMFFICDTTGGAKPNSDRTLEFSDIVLDNQLIMVLDFF